MPDLTISSPKLIPAPVCLIDGLTRTGKSLVCQLFPALNGMEHPHFFTLLEQILPLMEHKAISTDAAKALITLQLNEFFCDYILARKANFRPNELTSVFQSRHPQKFFENLTKEDKPSNLEEFEIDNSSYYSFLTHDVITHFDVFAKLKLPYKVITVFRNPVDTVWSWYTRGWGTRFTEDSRAFTVLVQSDPTDNLPWWCLPIKERYYKSNPMERCIMMHNLLLNRAIQNTKELKWDRGLLVLKFEDLCQNPDLAMSKISKLLNLPVHHSSPTYYERARVPRPLPTQDQTNKLDQIRLKSNPDIFNELLKLQEEYNQSFFGISEARIQELAKLTV